MTVKRSEADSGHDVCVDYLAPAQREDRIHVLGKPTLHVGTNPVYLDVECDPDREPVIWFFLKSNYLPD